MRVIHTRTGQFEEIDPERTTYGILSHTWDGDNEQTYEQLKKIQERCLLESRNLQSHPSAGAEREHAASPKLIRALPAALGRLTESEVEALLRLVAETFDLAVPSPTPSLDDPGSVPLPNPKLRTTPPLFSIWEDPELSPKIREACRIAQEKGYDYIWIDSCCIDKSSSAELSEAINSMYKWYSLAAVCYAYLADVPPGEDHHVSCSAFRMSRWFGRGWTLQELIAPGIVEFLSKDWTPIGSKHTLVDLVEEVTAINKSALLNLEPLDAFSVAQRLSWAAERKTTRVEDRAYSLLGIFDINMPTLYGEGERAFRRLQERIMQQIPDQSLFAWGFRNIFPRFSHNSIITPTRRMNVFVHPSNSDYSGLLALSPDFFQGCDAITTTHRDTIQLLSSHRHKIAYTSTPYGICTQFQMVPLTEDLLRHAIPHAEDLQLHISSHKDMPEGSQWYLAILAGCMYGEHQGHRLGRVCYVTPPDSEADVESVLTGSIDITSKQEDNCVIRNYFLLSPEAIEYCRRHTEVKTVHIPHPNHCAQPPSRTPRGQPYTAIKLVLLRETWDALYFRGYLVDLRHPDPDHPTTHWLTLSNDDHTITVEFKHTLENHGRVFNIEAEVKMSGSRVQLDSAGPVSEQADHHTVSWSDCISWCTRPDHRRVALSVAGARTLTMDLGLDFAGHGYYFVHVEIPASGGKDVTSSPPLNRSRGLWGTKEGKERGMTLRIFSLGRAAFRRILVRKRQGETTSMDVSDAEDTMTESSDGRDIFT